MERERAERRPSQRQTACRFVTRPGGCRQGATCPFSHLYSGAILTKRDEDARHERRLVVRSLSEDLERVRSGSSDGWGTAAGSHHHHTEGDSAYGGAGRWVGDGGGGMFVASYGADDN